MAAAWESGAQGKWHYGISDTKIKFISAIGNGNKAPLEVFLSQ
jgi:hypothetical protein